MLEQICVQQRVLLSHDLLCLCPEPLLCEFVCVRAVKWNGVCGFVFVFVRVWVGGLACRCVCVLACACEWVCACVCVRGGPHAVAGVFPS